MSAIFDATFYLKANPDVAGSVAAGMFTAEGHFEQFGRFENRAPSAFFDPKFYLAANPDVEAAIEANTIQDAYQHFLAFGIEERRDPTIFFDSAYYLAANPDVAAAVAGGGFASAFHHFLSFGLQETREVTPFFDLNGYLAANPDVAAAVLGGQTTAFDHFVQFGFTEGRDLGNGVSLQFFASDPTAQAAIEAGDFGALFGRIAEIAPFIEGFNPPAGYTIPSDQPIPTDFVSNEGEYLVLPEGVTPPEGEDLPPSFVQVFTLAQALAAEKLPEVYTLSDATVDFGAPLTVDEAIARQAAAQEIINNALNSAKLTLNATYSIDNTELAGASEATTSTLDLNGVQSAKEIWTDVTGATATVTAVYNNASLGAVYGVRGKENVAGEAEVDVSIYTTEAATVGDSTILKISLEDTEAGDYISVVARNGGVEHAQVNIAEGSSADFNLGGTATDLKTITITGSGDLKLSYLTGSKGNNINLVDASLAEGDITWSPDAKVANTSTAETLIVLGGSGNDTFNLSGYGSSRNVTIEGGDGDDKITGGAGNDTITGGNGSDLLTGNAGADTFIFTAGSSGASFSTNFDTITDFVVGIDKLQFAGVADVVSGEQAAVQAAVAALASGASDAQVFAAMATASTTDLGVSFATFEGNSYALFEASGAGTGNAATDVSIKLLGLTAVPTVSADVIA